MTVAFLSCESDDAVFSKSESSSEGSRVRHLFLDEIVAMARFGYNTFMIGCKKGADIVFAEQVLMLRTSTMPNIKLICAIPYEGQADEWSEAWRDRYFDIMAKCDDVKTLQSRFSSNCNYKCDRYMMDSSDVVITISGEYTAAWPALDYAQRQNRKVIEID